MLERLFVKDYKNTEDPVVRGRYGNLAGFIGIFVNLLIGALKLFIGLISNSVSIMADAVNNIFDMLSGALTIAGFKLAGKKPNREHPYGFARYEYVCAFVISLVMFVMGIVFAKESVSKIISPQELSIDIKTYIILGFGVLAKLFQMFEYKNIAKKINSNAVETTATDTRNDIISSTGILLSMIVMGVFKVNIDGYVGLAVSVLVIISSVGAIKEGLEPLIGIVPTKEQVDEIRKKLLSYPVVLGIHDMVIHNYGVNNDFVTVHCEVDSQGNILEIHDAIDCIERDFREQMGLTVTIHMDPVETNNQQIKELERQTKAALKQLDDRLVFHDFRVVRGPSHTNVVFDCVIPQDKDWDSSFFDSYLKERVILENTNLNFVVEIDRPFC